jgi:hypothetical protein
VLIEKVLSPPLFDDICVFPFKKSLNGENGSMISNLNRLIEKALGAGEGAAGRRKHCEAFDRSVLFYGIPVALLLHFPGLLLL